MLVGVKGCSFVGTVCSAVMFNGCWGIGFLFDVLVVSVLRDRFSVGVGVLLCYFVDCSCGGLGVFCFGDR